MFWDYDTQWGGDRSRAAGSATSWGELEFEHTERLLELHAAADVPACFAVVGSAALDGARPYHDPQQIRRIHEAGHEVASHSHRHEWLPGLDRRSLDETLRSSKQALEQCIGAPVVTFVPPYNQPFDYPAVGSISVSERREAGRNRNDLPAVCRALAEAGYRFCRVAYRSAWQRVLGAVTRREWYRPERLRAIRGITCVRLNTVGGFGGAALDDLAQTTRRGGLIVVYGHPHSLRSGNAQDERHLVPFLAVVRKLRAEGRLRVALPRDLLHEGAPA
jgi:peptidoglycan/xylan/chitin deacetylase (PgdA/CDA1 family)